MTLTPVPGANDVFCETEPLGELSLVNERRDAVGQRMTVVRKDLGVRAAVGDQQDSAPKTPLPWSKCIHKHVYLYTVLPFCICDYLTATFFISRIVFGIHHWLSVRTVRLQ